MNKALGPILIVVGILLLGVIPLRLPTAGLGRKAAERIGSWGPAGALLLGILFALTFCPVSAALFFGSLLPLAIEHRSPVVFPALYGIGTGLPVLGFALAIALGARSLGKVFDKMTQIERWVRLATAVVFIGVGIYLTLLHLFRAFG
jgi:cytochrome c biogenesis protein CcdA